MIQEIQTLSYDILTIVRKESEYIDSMIRFINENTDVKINIDFDSTYTTYSIHYPNNTEREYEFSLEQIGIDVFNNIYRGNIGSGIVLNYCTDFYGFKNELMDLYDKAFLMQKLNKKFDRKLNKTKGEKL